MKGAKLGQILQRHTSGFLVVWFQTKDVYVQTMINNYCRTGLLIQSKWGAKRNPILGAIQPEAKLQCITGHLYFRRLSSNIASLNGKKTRFLE